VAPVPAHAAGDAARRFRLFPAGGSAGQQLIASNLPDTLSLALPAFLLAVALAFALAFASRLPGLRWLSNFLQSLPVLFISLPTFWLGIALIQLFSFQLRWIPVINPARWKD
jgi:peptide/nickel transport system permease protein